MAEIESGETKKVWVNQAIMIYSSERLHWIDIRTYHQGRVDEATKNIDERTSLIANLEGKEQPQQLPLPEPIIIPRFKYSPKGFFRNFRK